jgi:hypothetical protein
LESSVEFFVGFSEVRLAAAIRIFLVLESEMTAKQR